MTMKEKGVRLDRESVVYYSLITFADYSYLLYVYTLDSYFCPEFDCSVNKHFRSPFISVHAYDCNKNIFSLRLMFFRLILFTLRIEECESVYADHTIVILPRSED